MDSSMSHIIPDTVEVSSDVYNTSTCKSTEDDDTMSTDRNIEHEEEPEAQAIGQNLRRPGGSQRNMNHMPIASPASRFKSRRLSRRVSQHDIDMFPSFNDRVHSPPAPMSYPRQSTRPMTPNSSTQHEANYSMPTLKLARKKRVNDMEWFDAKKLEPLPFSYPSSSVSKKLHKIEVRKSRNS